MSHYQGEKFKSFVKNVQRNPSKYGFDGKVSATDIAKMLGVTYMQLSRYYKSKELSYSTVDKITKVFNVTIEDVFGADSGQELPTHRGQGFKLLAFLDNLKRAGIKAKDGSLITKAKAAEMLGVSKQTLYQYFRSDVLSRSVVRKILTVFEVSASEIFGVETISEINKSSFQSNAKSLGVFSGLDNETPFLEISPGKFLMLMPLVPESAYAGYLGGYSDPEFIDELPKHSIIVDKIHRGHYVAFDVVGDSMTDGTLESIPDKSIAVGREIQRHHWQSHFHTHRFKDYIIVHKTDGIVLKRIVKHDVERGMITLQSLNPDKDSYPDFEMFLDDVHQVFNVVKVTINR